MKEVTKNTFEQMVVQSKQLVVVDFWAMWCGPCKMIHPILDELSNIYQGSVEFYKLDVDNEPTVTSQYQIRNIPTLLFFKDGKIVDKQVGAQPKSIIDAKIKEHL